MNAVEIEEAVSLLAEQPFDSENFPYAFLEAFGNKETTIKRLRAGASNKSDLGGVLQTSNIHIVTCKPGDVTRMLTALRESPATAKAKAKFILATDGADFEAEELISGDTVACAYKDFPDHFGFFLTLAGIFVVRQIVENSFDIRATSRLNRLYVELRKNNPDWETGERRHDMNHFMARLIFCFFAEDTGIFNSNLFTGTVEQMCDRDSSNTHEVIHTLFLSMNTRTEDRTANVPRWAIGFPYVNGGLFSGTLEVPRFSRIARSYLLHIGNLDWQKINPDIFGSMIQAVAEDAEEDARHQLGMHYTSVPNILKVLNPLFLDELRAKLEEAGDNPRMLLNLRSRMARIRVFDPACGSGNFLVIAYKEMRAIEAEINKRRGESEKRSVIPKTNFRGIEIRDFPAEIARLALVIAEYQCDVLYRGHKLALAEFLPLDQQNWITCGNALRLDWLSICPSTGTGVKMQADDLFSTPLEQAQIDFENEGGETYICGNPPFSGFSAQSPEQQSDLRAALTFTKDYKYFDYISGWFFKAAKCLDVFDACAFVSTNSVVQGMQVPILWRPVFALGVEVFFGYETFVWKNNAANNAGVFCVIIGLTKRKREKFICGEGFRKKASNINGYLADAPNIFVDRRQEPISELPAMTTGNVAYDGGHLIISEAERKQYLAISPDLGSVIRPLTGSKEFIRGEFRYCIWIPQKELLTKEFSEVFADRFRLVLATRINGGKIASNYAHVPYRFYMTNESPGNQILVPIVSSIRREYIPIGYLDNSYIVVHSAQSIFNAPLWVLALIASKMHLVWVNTVSGKLKGDFRYSAIICYNTFPLPILTEKNKADLTRCAENILLAREAHFPATIADLYEPDKMPEDLRHAHERNDEVLERIYIGRLFKNDTERLEKLFDLYTEDDRIRREGKGQIKRMTTEAKTIPTVSVSYARNGSSTKANAFGMRPMQERVYEKRGEQYLIIKSPPASGKSRALMFVALDKLQNQRIKQAIIVVPERSIGASFNDEALSQFGFWGDWHVEPKWNLCNAPGSDNGGKVKAVGAFLESTDKVLVCTHATFRFAVHEYGVEKFDDRLIAVDEFHHVAANEGNILGKYLGQFIARNRVHIVAMTGSYFRGDAGAILDPLDESKFETVTYTYYEQLNGYEYLKQLDIGYYFYSGSYADEILNVLDPAKKTIVHIPSVNSRESTKDKIKEVEHIIGEMGEWQGTDPATGFQLVKIPSGKVLRIADLVDDDPSRRDRVVTALKDPAQKFNRDHVDIIIALGMAKEGFDWIWCEHALTVGYRSSLTEIVQIIGRVTRDAEGKATAQFTNLIAEPDAAEDAVSEAVNDTLKAIAASLLMEQVLAPRFEFRPKNPENRPTPGYEYGEGGYDEGKCNVGVNGQTGAIQVEIKGLTLPKSKEATRICQEDLTEVIAAFVQDKTAIERGMFDEELVPEELTQMRMGKIVKDKYPALDAEDQEAVRQHAIAALNLTQQAKQASGGGGDEPKANGGLIEGVRRFAMDVRELDIDLIDRINPFGEAYAILAKTMSEESLKHVAAAISAKRTALTPEEALELAKRASRFKKEHNRFPSLSAQDPWERKMAEGAGAFVRFKDEGRYV